MASTMASLYSGVDFALKWCLNRPWNNGGWCINTSKNKYLKRRVNLVFHHTFDPIIVLFQEQCEGPLVLLRWRMPFWVYLSTLNICFQCHWGDSNCFLSQKSYSYILWTTKNKTKNCTKNTTWGATQMTRGIRLVQKFTLKGLFFTMVIEHYMRNVNRVSNSCKIGLKGVFFFFGDLTYL